jgi:hypothetical protein
MLFPKQLNLFRTTQGLVSCGLLTGSPDNR